MNKVCTKHTSNLQNTQLYAIYKLNPPSVFQSCILPICVYRIEFNIDRFLIEKIYLSVTLCGFLCKKLCRR